MYCDEEERRSALYTTAGGRYVRSWHDFQGLGAAQLFRGRKSYYSSRCFQVIPFTLTRCVDKLYQPNT